MWIVASDGSRLHGERDAMHSLNLVFTATLLAFSATVIAAEPAKGAKDAALEPIAIVPLKTAKLIIVEDFESTAVGAIPAGFTKKGSCAVVGDVAHSGMHALKLDAAAKGMRGLEKTGPDIAALG
ncbi:MAG TPA: hypothetical protein VHX44_05785, partial [Planctomycetota bacterium]|nr:hypothetical protein [Planctomycetota bacterium]